jgi:hypothetical protein
MKGPQGEGAGINIGSPLSRITQKLLSKAAAQADYESRIRAALKGPNDER